jgi:hypothetical protein
MRTGPDAFLRNEANFPGVGAASRAETLLSAIPRAAAPGSQPLAVILIYTQRRITSAATYNAIDLTRT